MDTFFLSLFIYYFFFFGGGGGSLLILTIFMVIFFLNQRLLFVFCDEIYPNTHHNSHSHNWQDILQ